MFYSKTGTFWNSYKPGTLKKRDNVKIKKTKNITTIYLNFKFLIQQQTIININSTYKKVINHKYI
jgi:hypothetical protein